MGQKFDNFGIWDKVPALVTVEGTVSSERWKGRKEQQRNEDDELQIAIGAFSRP
jgi:hypothetical protein